MGTTDPLVLQPPLPSFLTLWYCSHMSTVVSNSFFISSKDDSFSNSFFFSLFIAPRRLHSSCTIPSYSLSPSLSFTPEVPRSLHSIRVILSLFHQPVITWIITLFLSHILLLTSLFSIIEMLASLAILNSFSRSFLAFIWSSNDVSRYNYFLEWIPWLIQPVYSHSHF